MIFNGLKPADGDDCLEAAVSAVLVRAKSRGLWPGWTRWSTVELGLDEAELAWLREWAWQLRGTTLLPWLNSWRQHEASVLTGAGSVGLLLMVMAAETARREATEGTLWPAVAGQFAGDVRRLLFLHGQPTTEHKQALESAAWELNLRHVFGIDGLHNWVTSVYLQFGFTRRGFEANLPLWIAVPHNRSNAVEGLLEGPLRSPSFQDLWDALTGYRRHNVTAARLEAVLEHSPWVLPEWRESLVRLSQTKMHLGGGETDTKAGLDPADPDFLDAPTLRWDGVSPPEFVCHWQRLAELNLPEDEYTLSLGGQEMAKLRRQSDGSFMAYPDSELRLPAVPVQAALILDAEKKVAQTQIVACWDETEDISAFRLPMGERVTDAWANPLRYESSYTLVYASDLSIDPPAHRWWMTADGLWRFALLSSPRSAETQVLTPEGVCLWKPINADRGWEDWTTGISVKVLNRAAPHRWGEAVTVLVEHSTDISIAFARCHGQTLVLHAVEGGTRVGPVALTPGSETITPALTVGLTRGAFQICRRLPLPFLNLVGALYLTDGERRPLAAQTMLTTAQAQSGSFQLFADRTWNRADTALFEGETAVGRPRIRPASLPLLAGFGASLSLRSRAYNDCEEPLLIAQEVVNPGEIIGVTCEVSPEADGEQQVRVCFRSTLEPSPDHCLLWWGRDGILRRLEMDSIRANHHFAHPSSSEWRFAAPLEWGEPIVIAAAFEGARFGAWWAEDWSRLTGDVAGASEKAALIRWLRLPILSARSFRYVQKFAQSVPHEVLAAWIGDTGLPQGFEWGRSDERWLDAVRQIFSNWQPDINQARDVLKMLAPASIGETAIRLQTAASLLMRVDPHLNARVCGVWLREFSVKKYTLVETRQMCTKLCQAIAETTGPLDAQAARLLQEAATTMNCDDQFVKRGLLEKAVAGFQGHHLTPSDRSNIALALSVVPFRRLLALRLLQAVCP